MCELDFIDGSNGSNDLLRLLRDINRAFRYLCVNRLTDMDMALSDINRALVV